MAKSRVLVLGATGPAGICVLRELVHRDFTAVAYVRNRSKIPEDLLANPLLEVVEGQLDTMDKLSEAVARSNAVISLLGPQLGNASDPSPFPAFYAALCGLMRQHGVKRIFACCTPSYVDAKEDAPSVVRWLMVQGIKLISKPSYRAMVGIGETFAQSDKADGVDWTLFRVAMIPGGSDEESWTRDREVGGVYVGPVGRDWSTSIKRARLARWLVDCVESGAVELIGKTPCVGGTKEVAA
ncbi:hypothetical protein B0T22DRAFT_528249 [Podospora appendiculata]|uniref:NAD(P)-binding domain-containing protein n=1 Tax=Podospora appendiculata TaxID=314037 RepID=A0AAE0XBG6_9PEZI|nr:hypothetical protein B0T22DRAFT_528249 [Podospora appendiculata]